MVLSDEWLNEVWIAGFSIKDNRQMKAQVICGSNIKHISWRLKEMSVSKKKAGKEWLGVKKKIHCEYSLSSESIVHIILL